jgi:micrococcal nuclease
MKFPSFILFSTFLSLSCNSISQQMNNLKTEKGKVVSIIDGDTYDILTDKNKKIRIRMEGIDAPGKGMPFYKSAKNYLAKLCFEKYVRIEINSTDQYGRVIANSYLNDGTD